MSTIRRFAMARHAALVLCLTWCGGALADDRHYDAWVYREYRAAQRQQVGDLCDVWFPTWRPQAVAKTYKVLADR
jgi:hypothetical protein